jgi:hypothetical protein
MLPRRYHTPSRALHASSAVTLVPSSRRMTSWPPGLPLVEAGESLNTARGDSGVVAGGGVVVGVGEGVGDCSGVGVASAGVGVEVAGPALRRDMAASLSTTANS